ncbi:hypothetical protein MACK_002565 [Theileria orientalis]|uniref:Uncharacterized protein n=1 Tax=Theileria orientalis TaxID=68886 RepID=A0A976MD62_THEOR|nr:hypothetical protein MACK_002565 [Theileria orientalis]
MLTVFEKDRPSLLCNIVSSLLSNGSDLLVTGTVNDPIYIQSPRISDLGSASTTDHNGTTTTGDDSGTSNGLGFSDFTDCDSTQFVHTYDTSNTHTNDTHRHNDYTNNANKTINGGYRNGVTPNVNTAIESIHRIKSPGDDYYRHKFLLRLRKKQFYNNFDLGFYLLVKFGGPTTTMGISILNDDELLECSQISKLKSYRDVEKWYSVQYNYLLDQYRRAHGRKGLEGSQVNVYKYKVNGTNGNNCGNNGLKYDLKENIHYIKPPDPLTNKINDLYAIKQNNINSARLNKKLSKLIPCKKWFDPEKLHKKVVEQRHWNPFSIFGSSIPYVSINQVFNVESSDKYVVGRVKEGVLSRIDGNIGNQNANGTTRSEAYEIGNGLEYGDQSDEENSPNTMMMKYLQTKWIKESKKTINWNYDPLLNVEALWYINSTGRYLDMSKDVCVLQKCYCTTPDPSVRFNWNDPRNRRDSPRGSMGFMLDYNDYKRARSRYLELDDICNTSACKKANIRDDKEQNNMEVEDEIKLTYYSNYFRHNTLS